MEFEDKKKRYFVLAGLALIFIVVVFVIISFLNKETEIKQINQPQKSQQSQQEEQKNVNDYINVIYTGSGFVPPVVISSEQKINFKNITSENIELVVSQNDSDFSQTIMVSSDGADMQNFSPGEYTVTVSKTQDKIDITIKE